MVKNHLLFDKNRGNYYKQDWHDYYQCIIRLVKPGSYVLDARCGADGLAKYLKEKMNCRVIGIDLSDEAIKACKKKGIDIIKCDLEKGLPLIGTFDIIILSSLIESLIDPVTFLRKIKSNLNNGYIIVSVPNFSYLMYRFCYLFGINVKRYGATNEDSKLGVFGYDDLHFFNKSTLEIVLKKRGTCRRSGAFIYHVVQ